MVRRRCQVVKAVPSRSLLAVEFLQQLLEPLVAGGVGKFRHMVEKTLFKAIPERPLKRAFRFDRLAHLGAEFFGGLRPAGDADHREVRRHQAPRGQVVERRDQLAMCQVAGRPKDHQNARLRHPDLGQPFSEWIVGHRK